MNPDHADDVDALLSADKIVEIIFKCSRALDFANRAGVIHRDIKPANILLHGETDIKISDFGSALITTSMVTQVSGIGSPAYMSPQQIKEHPLTLQTDIYSLGVVMYQLLTGQLPFQASNNFSMMYQITNVEPQPPSSLRPEIPPAVDRIVRKAMQRELEQRYQDWDEFSSDLAAVISSEQAAQKKEEFADSEKFNILRGLPFPPPRRHTISLPMKILLIEDDPHTSAYVANGLREHGHVVDHSASGRDGLILASGGGYDVMVIDRMEVTPNFRAKDLLRLTALVLAEK